MDGHDLQIIAVDGRSVRITDGERTATYRPLAGEPILDMGNVDIKPARIGAGSFGEANAVTLTDGEHDAIYAPIGS